MAHSREQQKAIWADKTLSGKKVTLKMSDKNPDIFVIAGVGKTINTQDRRRAMEIFDAKIESENKRHKKLQEMKN
jgi:hypothetical protein